jgi:hypothetical protein
MIFNDDAMKNVYLGFKTQARLPIMPQPQGHYAGNKTFSLPDRDTTLMYPYAMHTPIPIQESYTIIGDRVVYKAGSIDNYGCFWSDIACDPSRVKWKSAETMLDSFVRYDIVINRYWIERIQSIRVKDIEDMAISFVNKLPLIVPKGRIVSGEFVEKVAKDEFAIVWNRWHSGLYSWDNNPWVWVLTFKANKRGPH